MNNILEILLNIFRKYISVSRGLKKSSIKEDTWRNENHKTNHILERSSHRRCSVRKDELMNCFCGMVDRRKAFSLISSQDHCQRSSRISNMPRAGFKPEQNLSSGLVEWSCAVVITTTPQRQTTTPQRQTTTPRHLFRDVLRNFTKFTGKHLCQVLFMSGLKACNFIKMRLWHWCFHVNFAKFLRTPFLQNTSGWLHLFRVNRVSDY